MDRLAPAGGCVRPRSGGRGPWAHQPDFVAKAAAIYHFPLAFETVMVMQQLNPVTLRSSSLTGRFD